MKSRNFLNINATPTESSPAPGLLLARAPHTATSDVAAVAAARRFESKHNQSPRFARRRAERRKGQALLLAVLIMLLAALLGAGFLAVVSGNLNQSARIADKTRAIEASRAGIAYANAQLSGSAQGDLWRPVDVSPAPAPGATGYDFYYSQLDQVQGWANKRAQNDPLYRETAYGKFPDPNQPVGDAPKFLVKVEELPTDSTAPNYDAEHPGEIKITSIGLSDDDPNVFHRSVAYKVGRAKSPWASALRNVSNYDFKTNQIPVTSIKTAGLIPPSTTPVDITVEKPVFSAAEVPFNIVIGQKQSSVGVQGAVVTKVNGTTLTLDHLQFPLIAGSETRVELAAAIGTAQTIDLFNTGTPTPFPSNEQPNGIRVNGSLWLQGQAQLSNLSKNGTTLRSSGVVALTSIPAANPYSISAIGPTSPNSTTDVATDGQLYNSQGPFPGKFTTVSGVTKADLIDDGWDRTSPILGSLTYGKTRNVEPFKPVDLTSKTNRDRYRNLGRSSTGVYVDNTEDIEKVGTRPMNQAELMRMWLSPKPTVATELFTRDKLTDPAITLPTVDAAANSLEEQHLRGWVSTDEFLARGALVELRNDGGPVPYIRVTLDSRADNTATDTRRASGYVTNKVWNNASGTPQPGLYTKDFAWPTNGTLYAEGNVRVRGSVANAPNSLTIVSQGNIYIEGSVGVDTVYNPAAPDAVNNPKKKLMLLARKNVVVNPTRLTLGHVDVQATTITGSGTPFPARQVSNLAVVNNTTFKIGDVIETSSFLANAPYTRTAGITGVITDITPTSVAVYCLTGGSVPTGSIVSTLMRDARANLGTDPKFLQVNSTHAFARRVLLPNSATLPNLRLALDHYGERKVALAVETEAEPGKTKPDGLEVFISNKRNAPFAANLNQVEALDKTVRGDYNSPTGSPDNFPPAINTTYSLADLEAAMNAKTHTAVPLDPLDPRGWQYKTTVPMAGANAFPFYFLAGVGLRYNPDRVAATPDTLPSTPDKWRSIDIGGAGKAEIPLATSVNVLRNRTQVSLETGQTGVTGITTPYLGFNPRYDALTLAVPPNLAQEDRLTVDQSFFQPAGKFAYSTLDSRKLFGILPSTNNVFTTDDVLTFQQYGLGPNYTAAQEALLPDYRVKSLKLEDTTFIPPNIPYPGSMAPIDLTINAYVYAQEGRWFVIPGDYFRTDAPVRALPRTTTIGGSTIEVPAATYIDYNNNKVADPGEYVDADNTNTFTSGDFADLNHNGLLDSGERDAVQRFLRYNYQINYYGAIVENKTAPIDGAVSEWTDKMATYRISLAGGSTPQGWKFINYTYDPSLAKGYLGSQGLRVPIGDDLLYQQ